MTETRPELIAHGIIHSHQCTTPKPTTRRAVVHGYQFQDCPDCGAIRLERTPNPLTTNKEN